MPNGNGGNSDKVLVGNLTREQFFEKTLKALIILLNGFFKKPMGFVLIIPETLDGFDRINFISNIKPETLADALRAAAGVVDEQMANKPPQTL